MPAEPVPSLQCESVLIAVGDSPFPANPGQNHSQVQSKHLRWCTTCHLYLVVWQEPLLPCLLPGLKKEDGNGTEQEVW